MKKKHRPQKLTTRREFLIGTAGLALATALPACSQTTKNVQKQAAEPEISTITDRELEVSCSWLDKGEHQNSYALYKKTLEAATDFSWLSKGDRLLIKIALNSGNPYPATTDPWSVHCMVKALKEKGAGKILVGDQSGFGTVQWTKDRKEGSSRQLAKTAGLLKVIEDSDSLRILLDHVVDNHIPAYLFNC